MLKFIKNLFIGVFVGAFLGVGLQAMTNGEMPDAVLTICMITMFAYPIIIAISDKKEKDDRIKRLKEEAEREEELEKSYRESVDNELIPLLESRGFVVNSIDYNKGIIEVIDPSYDKYCTLVYSIVDNSVYKGDYYYSKEISRQLYGTNELIMAVHRAITAPRISVGVMF